MVTEIRTEKAIIRIHRPELTEDERAKRLERIRRAAVNLILAAQRTNADERRQKNA